MNAPKGIELLGGLRVLIDGKPTQPRRQKAAALLAFLAFHRHQSHPREVIVEMLWPGCDPVVGRARLSTALWSLRRILEPPGTPPGSVIQASHFAVGLNASAVTTDVSDFLSALRQATRAVAAEEKAVALRQALDLYSGELLPGFYEDWVLTEQQRLAELHQRARQSLRALEKEGDAISPPTLTPPTSLPTHFTRFFGREPEMAKLQTWLSPASSRNALPRLVTITGTGGTGKTRLGQETARRLWDAYSGRIWFVPLTDLHDPTHIGSGILHALGLSHSGTREPLQQAIDFLKERSGESLLLLDNFEQLVDGGAQVVQTLLEQAPDLRCLVTSRRLLNLSHEREMVLSPLPTPATFASLENLTQFESVRMFVDRAQVVRPDFQITARNAPAVAQLCHRLEGVPLAIELAAARARVLSPEQMLAQMQTRFAFLVSRKHDLPTRHQALHSAIAWSYRLLSPDLRRFLAYLSVFRGGWDLEAAEAVCDQPQALEYLEQLRDRSFVIAEETDQGMRFRMLETIREFAAGELSTSERQAWERKHAHFFLAFLQRTITSARGGEAHAARARIQAEKENLRAVLEWWEAGHGNAAFGLHLVGALNWLWEKQNQQRESLTWLAKALARDAQERAGVGAPPLVLRANILGTAAHLCFHLYEVSGNQWMPPEALAYIEEELQIARRQNLPALLPHALAHLSEWKMRTGDREGAHDLLLECLPLYRDLGYTSDVAWTLFKLALIEEATDRDAARPRFEESLREAQRAGDMEALGHFLQGLAYIAYWNREDREALALFERAFAAYDRSQLQLDWWAYVMNRSGDVARSVGEWDRAAYFYRRTLTYQPPGEGVPRTAILQALQGMADLARHHGDLDRAARLSGAAAAIVVPAGDSTPHQSRVRDPVDLRPIQQALGENAFDAAWEAGRALSVEQAVALVLSAQPA